MSKLTTFRIQYQNEHGKYYHIVIVSFVTIIIFFNMFLCFQTWPVITRAIVTVTLRYTLHTDVVH